MQDQKANKKSKFPSMLKYLEEEIAPSTYELITAPPSKQNLLEGWLDLLKDEASVLDTPGSMKLAKDQRSTASFQEGFQRLRSAMSIRLAPRKVAAWHMMRFHFERSLLVAEQEEDLVAQMEAMRQYAAIRMIDQDRVPIPIFLLVFVVLLTVLFCVSRWHARRSSPFGTYASWRWPKRGGKPTPCKRWRSSRRTKTRSRGCTRTWPDSARRKGRDAKPIWRISDTNSKANSKRNFKKRSGCSEVPPTLVAPLSL